MVRKLGPAGIWGQSKQTPTVHYEAEEVMATITRDIYLRNVNVPQLVADFVLMLALLM